MKGVECHLSSSLQLLWQEEGRGQEGGVSSIPQLTITLAGGVAVSGVGAINSPASKQLNTWTINTNVYNKYSSPINIKIQNPYTPPYC